MFRSKMVPVILLLILSLVQGFEIPSSDLAKLRNNLLSKYDPKTRPVKDSDHNTTIKFAIAINNIHLNDHNQRMTAVTYLFVAWNDEFLHWFPSDYHNIYAMHFDKDEIWMPDIALFNSAHSDKSVPTSNLPVLCNYDGNVLWVPPFTAEVPCEMDLENWPSDIHTCVLKFGSWAHHGDQIDLQVEEDKAITLQFLESNKRWSILNFTATKEFTEYRDELYMHIDFKFSIKREAASHAAYITQTVFGVMIIVLGSYILPLNFHLSKFLLHLFSILILVICNFVLFATLPSTGGSIPHAVKYYFGSIILTTLSLLCNIIMTSTMAPSDSVSVKLPKNFSKVLKLESPSFEFESRNVPYSSLDEESIGTTAEFEEEVTPSPDLKKKKDKKTTITLYRLLNAVLFSVFLIAFLIDFTIMKKIIEN